MDGVPQHLDDLVRRLFPGSRIEQIRLLAADTGGDDTHKVEGYGAPLRVTIREAGGEARVVVFRTATANCFGHDRRSDRAAGMLLAYDTFNGIPDHVRALDAGVIRPGGRLLSLGDGGEFYLLTSFAEGRIYADDLRRIAAGGVAGKGDLARVEALSRWLVRLHAERFDDPDGYRRAVRDLIGHGEGLFGMVDGAPSPRLRVIEERCLAWRWKLRGKEARLARVHGDFHPFNVVFGEGARFTLLDASRGCRGDPADDVTAMAINFVFFAIDRPAAWAQGLGPLWRRFWEVYLRESGDDEVLEVLAPWLAWRAVVVCSPRFYPNLPESARERILGFAERALEAPRFDPAWAGELFP